ncbi:hypothetical protein N7326_02160 [Corynebacterium sp. ES2794-CONJ1]|nr:MULTISPECIES: hypothetical protein [unclassified Corynebacterium]MCS4488996.1 hypothetical protein [Corynebacterium sp. ES2775-CONJ]MCS4490809.1 hypothetical protein [Corynebacterium sp. ES2715-CONJ3]MCS4531308.1 hypothetical protein [Corynebacterium sp. ES2730-CONJ]MCU9518677.1 hypothetical protein [Corynebacterium sp. ES2794-CONJ1]
MKIKIIATLLLLIGYVIVGALDFHNSVIAPMVCVAVALIFFWPSRKDS